MSRSRTENAGRVRVSLFCGGRGSAALIHELMRRPDVELSLLVNAYDDGLSTGELRDFVPGMLGPSDFRKNLTRLLDLFSSHQFALTRLLEYRLPVPFAAGEALLDYFVSEGAEGSAPASLDAMLMRLDGPMRHNIFGYLRTFAEYSRGTRGAGSRQLSLADCSIGNLIFTGAYLESGENFNLATQNLSNSFHSRANLVNVTRGDNCILVGVKEDGELLERESHVVGEQSLSPIRRIFLLPEALGDDELEALKPLDRDEKIRRLEAQSIRVGISPEARTALKNSDIIVYGSGTQHSSLYPSYMTSGIREAIEESAAPVKALLVNIGKDHDIQSLCATDIVDGALDYLGDPDNAHGSISHILCSSPVAGESSDDRLPCDYEGRCYQGALWLMESLQNSNIPGIHSGLAVAESLLSLHAQARSNSTNQVEVFVALNERSFAADLLVQEFLDLPWKKVCEKSCLTVAGAKPLTTKLPEHIAVEQCDASGVFPEVSVFSEWLQKGDAEYLVTLTGDGIYRLKDIFMGVRFLNGASFGAVFGSRNQQRKQFFTSLHSAYGESKTLYGLSWLASFLVGAAFSIRYQMFFSDPLTGFRIYKRAHIAQRLKGQAAASGLRTPSDITKLLIHSSIDIAEVPVGYRTFKGFTNMRWRILRGARNAWSVIF